MINKVRSNTVFRLFPMSYKINWIVSFLNEFNKKFITNIYLLQINTTVSTLSI